MIFPAIIPNENRREQMELCQRLGELKFLDHVWSERRDADAAKPKWNWPLVTGAQEAFPPLTAPKPAATLSRMRLAK